MQNAIHLEGRGDKNKEWCSRMKKNTATNIPVKSLLKKRRYNETSAYRYGTPKQQQNSNRIFYRPKRSAKSL